MRMIREGGFFAYIIPAALLTINYTERLREWIVNDKIIMSILDARKEEIFVDVAVSTVVIAIQNKTPTEDHRIKITGLPQFKRKIKEREVAQAIFKDLSGYALRIDIT